MPNFTTNSLRTLRASLRNLRKESGLRASERVRIGIEIFDHADNELDMIERANELENELGDLHHDWGTLRQIYERFPSDQRWETCHIQSMVDQLRRERAETGVSRDKVQRRPTDDRQTVIKKLTEENKKLRCENRQLKHKLAAIKTQVEKLVSVEA
jgi:regulator of replication initiation timing